jgi:hypothetical protein
MCTFQNVCRIKCGDEDVPTKEAVVMEFMGAIPQKGPHIIHR